jgi:solute carrier family 35
MGMDAQTAFAAMGYMSCSALMLIGNKLAVHYMPAPSFVLWCQLFSSAAGVWLLGLAGLIQVDALNREKILSFGPVALVFTGTLFCNMKTLQYANVETFIVFRASTPIAVSVADWLFLGRELPNKKSTCSLAALAIGAYLYTVTDAGFQVKAYMWLAVWYGAFLVDQIYIKHVVDTVKMDSNWGRVYYCNLLASFPLIFTGLASNETAKIEWTFNATMALGFSCVLGLAMSYFAFMARKLVSATYFSIIGNVCKIMTVIINYLIWDKHATPFGMSCLFGCLVAAYFYDQAPLRKVTNSADDVEQGVAMVKK